MNRQKKNNISLKIILNYVALISWMLLIFWFSSQGGIDSSQLSDGILMRLVHFIEKMTGDVLNNKTLLDLFAFLIRKLAHFTLYFVLGILWMRVLKEHSISIPRQMIYAMLFCLVYACSDEIHQLFVEGRSGQVRDVCIDFIGCCVSILPIYWYRQRKIVST